MEDGEEETYRVAPLFLPKIDKAVDDYLGDDVEFIIKDGELTGIRSPP